MFVERITKDQMKMFLETFACCSEQKNLVMRLNYAGKVWYILIHIMILTVHTAVIFGISSCIHSSHMSITQRSRSTL